jgi:hypothetical protein
MPIVAFPTARDDLTEGAAPASQIPLAPLPAAVDDLTEAESPST